MDLELKGKAAIVTGGNRGIGKAIAKELAREGVNVAIVARDKAVLAAAAKEIAGNSGVKVLDISADTGDDAAVKKMVADVASAFGRIDILVNCAAQAGGQGKPPTLTEITNEHFWADMNVKVLGYLRTAREVAPHMIKQGSGPHHQRVGPGGAPDRHHHRLHAQRVGRGADQEPGRRARAARHLRRVRASGPHAHREDAGRGGGAGQGAGLSEAEIEKRMAARNLARKIITAEEIAYVVAFIASPKAVALNGDVIAAGGGAPGSIHY